jgi:hypothetical protein
MIVVFSFSTTIFFACPTTDGAQCSGSSG